MTWAEPRARWLAAKRLTLITTHALVSLTSCLPALTGAAEVEHPVPPPVARIEVTHTDEGLRVHAMQARPEDVVRRIAEVAGFEVHVARELGHTVTLTTSGLTLEGTLRKVLGTASVAMLYGPRRALLPPRIEAVWIYGPGGQPADSAGHAASVPVAAATGRAPSPHRHPTTTAHGRAVAALTADLRSTDQQVRAEAVGALTSLGGPIATLRLGETVLGDAVPQVRLLAVHALEVLGTEQARVFLERAVDDPDPHVSTAAADVLTRLP